MNVVNSIFTSSIVMCHVLVFMGSIQGQQTPPLRKSYHYELLHPRLTTSPSRSKSFFSSPPEISTRLPIFHPRPKFSSQPSLNNFNDLFQTPGVIKDVTSNFLPDFLFTPSTFKEPAATLGQIENYNKDIDELIKEQEQERSNATASFGANARKEPTLYGANSGNIRDKANSSLQYKYVNY